MIQRILTVAMLTVLGGVVMLGCGGAEQQPVEQVAPEIDEVVFSRVVCYHGSHGEKEWGSGWTNDRAATEKIKEEHRRDNPGHIPSIMTRKKLRQR